MTIHALWLTRPEFDAMSREEVLRRVESVIEEEFRTSGTLDSIVARIEWQDLVGPPAVLTLNQIEREHIVKVLEMNGWKRHKSAKDLGIDPSTLFRKMRDYGLNPPPHL